MSARDAAKIPKRIESILFTLMDPNEIRKMSSVEVKTADTYKDDGHAYKQGLMDPKMGVIDPGIRCETCGNKHEECPSHFGHIALELPVMHIGFTNLIKTCLKATCNSCSKILLLDAPETHPLDPEKSEQDYYRDRVNDIILKHGVGGREFKKIIKDIENVCSGAKRAICMHCGSEQGKILLDKPTTFKEKKADKGEHKLNARDIREWLEKIPDEHLIFLGMEKTASRPEWTIMKVLPVPPITVRPSITLESGDRSEDDLTHKLVDVLRINQRLRENRDSGAPQLIVEDLWELLQYHCTTYFDNQTSGIPPARHRSGRPLKTLSQRLKGKEGRFRSNLSGKRVNFCARTVISPDPNLGINEVGVPVSTAMELTVPIRVTSRNREQLRQMILRGPDIHPGVNYIIRGDRYRVRITDRTKFIWAGFRCLNPECHSGSDEEPYAGYRPDLNQVLPAPNFLPGLVLRKQMRRDPITDELLEEWDVDLDNTLSNLKGEDSNGKSLANDDPNAIIHNRWRWEVENPDEYLPEHLEVRCPHCGSPEVEDEHGNIFPTDVEDRLSTYDRDGNPKPGVVVERHLIDSDVAIFNRQPSLHRMSMLVHEIRVMPGKTFRFNLADCTPYNADFDGDEMNLHVIQSEEARAEARILMRVQEHIISPRYGGSVIGGIHDHISGAYLLTHGKAFLPKHVVMDVLSSVGWSGELPEEVEHDGVIGFHGNDVFSLLVREGFTLNFKNRAGELVNVSKGDVLGSIDKRGIGAEDGRLLDAVVQTHGTDLGAEFINKMTKMTIAICTAMGFTTGIDDQDLPPEAKKAIQKYNLDASEKVDEELVKFGKDGRKYEARPGRTPLETLEENILTILDEGKAKTGTVAKEHLGQDNSAVLMATSGARGSMDNLAMMAGSIGQPKVRGKRLERGYQERVLSHFPRKVKGAKEKGFVSSSFKRGLEPTEFFMLSVSGRESLVDTAVRTSKSGYMQRRLINAMDDLKVSMDDKASVRNTANKIIQFEYGEDGVDPARSRKGSAFDVGQILDDVLGGEN
ncbi:MAG: DNA-directed RNA polymerase subunit A' [Euryarchaeota archaeon]|nr:DNA-directed RNA polymerase subunit A' [Euryarchaeota archaeon]